MANSDKNILITPSVGQTAEPTIKFTGANNTPTTLRILDDGTLSFEATAGQLFSISDGLTGTIFSVNDISGIPSIEVLDAGTVRIAQYSGNVGIGVSSPSAKLSLAASTTTTPSLNIPHGTAPTAPINGDIWTTTSGLFARINGTTQQYAPLTSPSFTTPNIGAASGTSLSLSGNLTVSTGNTSGGGIILADDGDIVDLNDGYASLRFTSGVRIYSGNRTGSAVITLGNNGIVSASSFSSTVATGTAPLTVSSTTVVTNLNADYLDGNHGSYYLDTSATAQTKAGDLTISGNLTVNGTTTTINSTTISVDDKNIELGSVASPTNTTADGGGITLKGATDKTFNWVNATGSWTSSEDIDLASGKVLRINGAQVLSATQFTGNAATVTNGVYTTGSYSDPSWLTISKSKVGLSNVENTALSTWSGSTNITTLGTITSGTWQGSVISTTYTAAKVTSVNGSTGAVTGLATTAGKLSQFAATTSAELAGVISDETGSGALVFANSPVFTTPNIGVATGTSFNSITGLSSTTPSMDGTAAIGTATTTARADHIHPSDTSRAADSTVVHLAGSETITGQKTFTGKIRMQSNLGFDAGQTLYFGYEEGFGGTDTGGLDYGYITFDNNNSTYGTAGGETSVLRIGSQNDGAGSVSDSIAIEAAADIYLRPGAWGGTGNIRVGTYASNNLVWHAGNDGAGSGLDADLLDGQQGSYYAPIASPTFTGTVILPTSAAGGSSIRIPHGTAPTAPTNGDIWTTTSGLFAQINGSTQQYAPNNQTMYIGTTSIAINRASGAISLTGTSIDGNAGTVTNGVYTTGSYADPAWITSLAKSKVGLGNVENTALSTWAGSSSITTVGTLSTPTIKSPKEIVTASATAATGTIQFDVSTQSILYYTTNASANWTLNVRGNASTTLNAVMNTGESLSVVFMVTNGATPYYQTGFTIDGTSVTPKWQGGSAPTAGNASSVDIYTFSIIKTAATSASATATGTSATTTITTSAIASGTIAVGQLVSGTGIAPNAVVTAVSGSAPTQTVTLSIANTATVSGTITFTPYMVLGSLTGFA